MSTESERDRVRENFASLYEAVQLKLDSLSDKGERETYLNKLLIDCNKILELAELFDDDEITGEFVKRLGFNLDDNLINFLDGKEIFIEEENQIQIKEKLECYIITKVNNWGKNDITTCVDGIQAIREVLNRKKKNNESEEPEEIKDDFNVVDRIKIKSSLTDVVRIFEAMKQAEIISDKTPVRQYAELFFSDIAGQIRFERNYNATKNRIEKLKSTSNSKELLNFILFMIEKCYKGKDSELEKIVRHIEYLQKNII